MIPFSSTKFFIERDTRNCIFFCAFLLIFNNTSDKIELVRVVKEIWYMNNGKGNMILLTIICIATLLVAVVGATFAYFNIALKGENTSKTIEVTGGSLSTEYNGDAKISGSENAGETIGEKSFTVTGVVTGSSNLNYESNLVITNNTYPDDALVYTLVSTNTSNNGVVMVSTSEPVAIKNGASTIVLGTGTFAGPTATGSTHTYVVKVECVNGDAVDKAFDATITVGPKSNK